MNDYLGGLSLRQAQILVFAMLAAFAACFKLAAWLYRRTQLTWPNAFLVLAAVLVGSMALPFLHAMPAGIGIAIRLAVAVAIGALMLKLRAKTAEGQPLANADSLKISAMGYGFLSVFTAAISAALLMFVTHR